MNQLSRIAPSRAFFTELPSMILRLRTKHLRFVYTFESGYQLVGLVEGDYFTNSPDLVFNLRSLSACCLNPQGSLVMTFDDVFGQLSTRSAEAIVSGSQSEGDSFFSFNYRNGEATIYDAHSDAWIATGWSPHNWRVEELVKMRIQPSVPRLTEAAWQRRAIA